MLAKYPVGQLSFAKRQVCCMEKKKIHVTHYSNIVRGELWTKARGESLGMRSHLHYLHPPEW